MDHCPPNFADVSTPLGPAIVWGANKEGQIIVQLRQGHVTVMGKNGYSYQTRVTAFDLGEIELCEPPSRRAAKEPKQVTGSAEFGVQERLPIA